MAFTQSSETATGGDSLAGVVAGNVRVELARRGMTARDLADAIGRTPFYLGRRLGRQQAKALLPFDVDDLESVARALGVTPELLLQRPTPHVDVAPAPRVAAP